MAATQLLTAPTLRSIDAVLDAEDGSKFSLHLVWRALAATGPVELDITVPNLALNTWDGSWWADHLAANLTDALINWGFLPPA